MRSRNSIEDTPDGSMILLSSLSLLLITFFIFLNSLAIPNAKKEASAIESLQRQFPVTSALPRPQPIQSPPEALKSLAEVQHSSISAATKKALPPQGTVLEEQPGITITIPTDQVFQGEQLLAGSIPFLQLLAEDLRVQPRTQIQVLSKPEASLAGSGRRAQALYAFLLERGVKPSSVSISAGISAEDSLTVRLQP